MELANVYPFLAIDTHFRIDQLIIIGGGNRMRIILTKYGQEMKPARSRTEVSVLGGWEECIDAGV